MKKLLLTTLCLLLVLCCSLSVLVGCKKSETPGGGNPPSDQTPEAPQNPDVPQAPSGGDGDDTTVWIPTGECTSGLSYHPLANGYTVTGIGTATDENIVIPATHQGKPVVAIEAYAFYNCEKSIKSVTIPGTVTSIGERAFFGNYHLNSLYVGQGVKRIDANAFWNCHDLENVSLPSSLLYVGANAFYGCDNVTYTELENGKYLGNDQNPCVMLMGVRERGEASFAVEAKTKFIYDNAFDDCTALQSLSIPDSVIGIGQNAFADCTSLSYAHHGNGKYLGNAQNPHHALIGCVDASATSLEICSEAKVIGTNAFRNARISSLSIPASVVTIGDGAFRGCSGITSLTLAEGLRTIGTVAFLGCNQIPSVTLPASLSVIACDALFDWNTNALLGVADGNQAYIVKDNCLIEKNSKTLILTMKTATLPTDGSFTVIGDHAMRSYPISGAFAIPQGVTRIGIYAFFDQRNMTAVSFPEALTSISSNAFERTGLTSLFVPSTVTELGFAAFSRCQGLTSATVNANVKTLSDDLFSECSALQSVSVGSPVTRIGDNTFALCMALESFSVPTGVTQIGKSAFESCVRLATVSLPAGLVSIDDFAFENCYALSNITLPAGLEEIGNYAFSGCYELSIVIPANVESIMSGAFASIGGPIYCELIAMPSFGWSENWTNLGEDQIIWGYTAQ